MRILPSLALAIVLALVTASPTAVAEQAVGTAWIYVGVYDDDRPFVDYEGDAPARTMGARQATRNAPYVLTLRTMPGVPGEIRFEAEARRVGRDGFRLEGTLETEAEVRVQLVKMIRSGDASGETFPELVFAPGRHAVRFEGRLVGWLER